MMMQTELVFVNEYCDKCHIEPSFINLLKEGGLIDVCVKGDERFLFVSQLPALERYSRMYYELSINVEGIDAIHHLLARIDSLENEVDRLRKQLLLYRSREVEEMGW